MVVLPRLRVPALSWLPGHLPAHLASCGSVGKRVIGLAPRCRALECPRHVVRLFQHLAYNPPLRWGEPPRQGLRPLGLRALERAAG